VFGDVDEGRKRARAKCGLVQSQCWCWCFGGVVLLCLRCAEEWVHRAPDVKQECGESNSDNGKRRTVA
jgi:hypothetical protein